MRADLVHLANRGVLVSRTYAVVICLGMGICDAATRAADVTFPQGTFTLQASVAYAEGLESRQESIPSASVGLNYFVWDNLSLGVELEGLRAIQDGDDAWAGEIGFMLHHHLIRFDRYTIFGDFNFGPVWSNEQVPADGTQFNFITRVGAGATARLTDDLHLMLGVRYFHLSNARIEGVERNPNINGVEGYLGLVWVLH
jgi:hypothetical protein